MARRSTSWGTEEPAPEQQADVPEFKDAGYEETLPGQVEVVAGTPEHERVLSSYANATSYGPDVNVVAAAGLENTEVPNVSQSGSELTCTMGIWSGEPTSYAYAWQLDGAPAGTDSNVYAVGVDDVGKSATCTVTATNASGSASAPPSNAVVVA